MIQKNTKLIPVDRCGVVWVKVFHLYGGWSRKVSHVGEFVKSSVKEIYVDLKIKRKLKIKTPKKAKVVGFIIRTTKEISKNDGSFLKFLENNAVLLKRRMTPRGKELVGPIVWNIKRKKFLSSFGVIL